MPQGKSLHVGLNFVDAGHYQGWSGPLRGCEADAQDMENIARNCGFATKKLLTKEAKRSQIISELESAANQLRAGDIFFLSISCHGGQVPDVDGDESDGEDETWCLYDSQLVDDEIYYYLSLFDVGVRVLVISDSCHSGSVLRNNLLTVALESENAFYRAIPDEISRSTYMANKDFYDEIAKDQRFINSRSKVKASCLLIAACQDNQLSRDGTFNGLFTSKLKVIWNGGKFSNGYNSFYNKIVEIMPHVQTPNLFWAETSDSDFLEQRPFTI